MAMPPASHGPTPNLMPKPVYHPETGLPGHWETRHLPEGQTVDGYETVDIWIPHCLYHTAEALPCYICEAAAIGDDEGPEA